MIIKPKHARAPKSQIVKVEPLSLDQPLLRAQQVNFSPPYGVYEQYRAAHLDRARKAETTERGIIQPTSAN
jgi:hypothetical protein